MGKCNGLFYRPHNIKSAAVAGDKSRSAYLRARLTYQIIKCSQYHPLTPTRQEGSDRQKLHGMAAYLTTGP